MGEKGHGELVPVALSQLFSTDEAPGSTPTTSRLVSHGKCCDARFTEEPAAQRAQGHRPLGDVHGRAEAQTSGGEHMMLCSFSRCAPGATPCAPPDSCGRRAGQTQPPPRGAWGARVAHVIPRVKEGRWSPAAPACVEDRVRTSYHLPPSPQGAGVSEEAQGLSGAPGGQLTRRRYPGRGGVRSALAMTGDTWQRSRTSRTGDGKAEDGVDREPCRER